MADARCIVSACLRATQVFSQHQSELVVFGKGIDYTTDQRIILDTHQALSDSNWSAYGTLLGRCGQNSNTWLENMYAANGICPQFNATGEVARTQ